MKRTLLCTLCSLVLSMMGVNAWGQSDGYHIPNGDFSKWKTTCGSTYQTSKKSVIGGAMGANVRPGVEPEDWNGSNINQTVVNVNKLEPGLVTSDNSDKHVVLTNKYVGVNLPVGAIGSSAPAYITFGTPWVYAVSDVKSCDGGTYGGTDFKGRPDAIKGIYKRTAKESENAYVIAYLWSGTFKSDVPCSGGNGKMSFDDVDKAVLGKVTATSQGKLVASCEKSFATTENNDWETIEVPLEYEDEAAIPEKMNVIISGADYWTRGNIKEENILEFTCPNRDGSKGTGGCTFCASDGTGHFAGTISQQIDLLSDKWPEASYIAYFQNHTNTYAPATELREKYYDSLNHDKVVGLAIATRPDCISDEVLSLLAELNEKTFMWVELGLHP